MIPIGDSVRSRTFPYVNIAIIAACVLAFLYQLTLSTAAPVVQGFAGFSELDLFFFDWGAIPACLTDRLGRDPEVDPRALAFACPEGDQVLLTPISAMFIHGGWLHLIGNMIFLWVFGDNVEDAMGHARYAAFYVLVGVLAAATHIAVNQNDVIPAVGASGAIAGVLGAYLVLYPRATVSAILPIFILFWIPFQVPAIFLIGFWFLMQLFNGVAGLAATDIVNAGGGVAWFAHIGGFVAGLVLVRVFVLGRRRPPRGLPPPRR
ncbi:MAG: rhomboid family intramembrane serine protease [Dehalococcoidia bacterium]